MKFFDLNQLDHQAYEQMKSAEQAAKRDKLRKRFTNRFNNKQPFLIRNQQNRQWSAYLSYFFNLVSLIGLWYAAKVILEVIPIPYLNYIIAAALLVGFEVIKRKYSDAFWDHWFATSKLHPVYFTLNFIILFGISLGGSVYGVYFVATDHSPEARFMGQSDDPEAVALQDRVNQLDTEIKANRADQSNYNSAGEFYYNLQITERNLSAEKQALTETLREKHGIYTLQNQDILTQWQMRRDFRAWSVVILTILFELLFELCMRFNSKYDYVLYQALVRSSVSNATSTPQSQVNIATRPRVPENGINGNRNGIELSIEEEEKVLPIGFFTPQQKMEAGFPSVPTPEQACPRVDTADSGLDDLYTIEHQYERLGRIYTVRYTQSRIEGRIREYDQKVKEAVALEGQDANKWTPILERRRWWLKYWQAKLQELEVKQQQVANV